MMINETHPIRSTPNNHAAAPSVGRRAARTIHLFKRSRAGQYCLSIDRSGTNIPPGLNGEAWIYVKDLSFAAGEYNAGVDAEFALDELGRTGYFLIGEWYDAH